MDAEEIFEYAYLEFDHAFLPMDNCARDHPKEHILSDPNSRVLTRSQNRARNEVLNVHQELCMFNVFISKLEPKTVNVALEHSDWVIAMKSELAEF